MIPKHYDNSKGTLYKVATERGWNSYLFDIVKRLERAEKKGEFKTDLEKSKVVIDLWLSEATKQSDTLLKAKHNELIQQFEKLKKEQLEYFSEVELINHLGKKGYSITIKREL